MASAPEPHSAPSGAQTVAAADRWIRTDTWNFVSFCLGMLLENFVHGMAWVATGRVSEPPSLRSLLLAWAPIWLILLFPANLLFAAGGEMNTIMATTQEVMPTRHRSKASCTIC